MSADPAGFALINPMGSDGRPKASYSVIEATNWYAYVSGNPVKYVDPTGEDATLAATAGVAVAVPEPITTFIGAVLLLYFAGKLLLEIDIDIDMTNSEDDEEKPSPVIEESLVMLLQVLGEQTRIRMTMMMIKGTTKKMIIQGMIQLKPLREPCGRDNLGANLETKRVAITIQ